MTFGVIKPFALLGPSNDEQFAIIRKSSTNSSGGDIVNTLEQWDWDYTALMFRQAFYDWMLHGDMQR